ncbi:MAG: CBS domain-containing protein [Pseudonocardia sp.]|nr:CBS domain-containing protein [Pseudonocardia sp.]
MVLRAREIMTERVVTIWEDAPLSRAEQRMAEFRYSALPVVDRAFRLVGIVSLVDLLRHRDDPDAATVADVMTRDVLYMSPTANIAILAHRLRAYGELRVMPIVDRGVLVGVVTRSDLLRRRTAGSRVLRSVRRAVGADRPAIEMPAAASPRGAGRIGSRDPATLSVSDVMTGKGLITVAPATPVDEAAEVILAFRFTAVPVVDIDDRLVGILSEADLMSGPLHGGRRTRARTVGEAMTREVEALGPDEPLARARSLLSVRGFRVVPVVDADDVLVGVLSRSDLL